MADDPTPPINDPATGFQNLLAKKNNDAMALASQLFDENFQLRTKNRDLADKLPKDGSLVLTAEEAKEHNKLKTFLTDSKLEFKTLKEMVEKFPELEKSNKDLAGMETYRELADIGLDGSKLKLSVLKDQLGKFPDAVIRFDKQKDKDGNESKVAFIKTTTDGTELSFTDFAAQNLSDYLPALKVTAEQQPLQPGNTHDPKPNGATGGIFDRIRESVRSEDKAKAVPTNIDARFGKAA